VCLNPRDGPADAGIVFRTCRYCGAELSRARKPLEVCSACENSPLCDRCGHPRGDHTHVFARGVASGCNRMVGDFQTLTSWRCDCEGFRPISGSLGEASFAQPDPDAAELPPLRLA
jgi:hypothetical protein